MEHGFDLAPVESKVEIRGWWIPQARLDIDGILQRWDALGVVVRGPEAVAPLAGEDFSVSQRLTTPEDSVMLAWALADLLRGDEVGMSPDVARGAAALYATLKLPRAPLVATLSHPNAPASAKVLALRILAVLGEYDSEIGDAIRSAICALVGRVDGIEKMAGVEVRSMHAVLTWDEIGLVSAIAVAGGQLAASLDDLIAYVTSGMPEKNAVIMALRRNVR